MKFKKPSKKLTIIFTAIIIVGLFILFMFSQNSKLKSKNEKQIVKNYVKNLLKNSYDCSLYTGKINESLLQDKFDKNLIIEGLNYCKKSVFGLKKVNAPRVKSKETYLLLQKLKQEIIKGSKCNAIFHQRLLQTNNSSENNYFSTNEKYKNYEQHKIKCDSGDLTIFEILDELSLIYDKR